MKPSVQACRAVADSPVNGPTTDERTLAAMRDMGVTVEVDAATLRALVVTLDKAIEEANAAVALIRNVCGPSPSSIGGQVATMVQMGTGYHRAAKDTIKALFVARNVALQAAKKRKKGAVAEAGQ